MLVVVAAAGYLYLAVNTEWSWVKNAVYYQVLEAYGRAVASQVRMETVLNPGLREEIWLRQERKQVASSYADYPDVRILGWKDLLQGNHKFGTGITIAAITPHAKVREPVLAEAVLKNSIDVLVECSRMDKWHTTAEGWRSLTRLRANCLRVVVFDGGHHISTLGTCPDIILVPEVGGYAAHSYMKDGVKIDVLRRLLGDAGVPSAVVAVPRWAVVKTPSCLGILAYRAFTQLAGKTGHFPAEGADISVLPGTSKLRETVFCYWNGETIEEFSKNIKSLGLQDVNRICIAFNYGRINPMNALGYTKLIKKQTGKQVTVVNEPINVFDAVFRPGFGSESEE